ncbi:hypothetical protein C7T35_15525 [Variovorax sp. WS11]|uniref:hypothetical protein n=1 Tax=Variovorax sp. WS11 TaxID=1105204 RepID=UPI000D0D2680|nr:hypothetical protein [Variovorax sp. WS11]NDZ12026.1 hypothetical protein [Variovorax sp. WS11]PSL83788.1 hypothetical protein C7T35_15525 [Variovorax sp. WS11]
MAQSPKLDRKLIPYMLLGGLAIALFFGLLVLEDCTVVRLSLDETTRKADDDRLEHWHFWIQFFTGSSWATWPDQTKITSPRDSCIAFTTAIWVHVLLNTGVVLGFVWGLYQVVLLRSASMKVANFIKRRDSTLKVQVKNVLMQHGQPADVLRRQSAEVDSIFENANRRLRTVLTAELGEAEAARVMDTLLEADVQMAPARAQ